jgi:glutamine amidotransferase
MIAVIDYGMGNLRSVEKGFHKVGIEVNVTNRPEDVTDAVAQAIEQGKPYLGICLGLQVLFSESEEFGRYSGLDIFRGKVVRFELDTSLFKIPQMGWNQLNIKSNSPLFRDIPDKSYFYFVHSFYVVPEDASIIATTTDYGLEFTSSICKDNVYAVQFHPEKSQTLGLQLLKNFGDIVAGK